MRVLVCPDKFKGTLTGAEAADAIARGVFSAMPDAELRRIPIADGGEGTVGAAVSAGATRMVTTVRGPDGQPVDAEWAVAPDGTAIIESAAASGLSLVEPSPDGALTSGSHGTGELIRAALDRGSRNIIVGLGGSAMTDGGSGALRALGGRLLDEDGLPLPPGGAALVRLRRLDLTELDPRLTTSTLTLASDVDAPLLGHKGAAAVFAPQKGAGPGEVALLDAGLRQWAAVLRTTTGAQVDVPGAGAAGGFPAAFLGTVPSRIASGFDVVAELLGLERHIRWADLVITGEGSLDAQSLAGKGPVSVARMSHARGVPCVAIAGVVQLTPLELSTAGFTSAVSLVEVAPSTELALQESPTYAEEATIRALNVRETATGPALR